MISNRIASYIETNEAFPARETDPEDFVNLEGYNPKGRKPSQQRSTPGQANE